MTTINEEIHVDDVSMIKFKVVEKKGGAGVILHAVSGRGEPFFVSYHNLHRDFHLYDEGTTGEEYKPHEPYQGWD